jgi:outer membrane protein TolC
VPTDVALRPAQLGRAAVALAGAACLLAAPAVPGAAQQADAPSVAEALGEAAVGDSAGAAAPPDLRGGSGALRPGAQRDTGPGQDTVRLSLDEVVRRATSTNEQVMIARAEKARAAGLVKEVRSDALPSISANFGYTRNIQTPVLFLAGEDGVEQISIGSDNEYTIGLTARQTLFDPSLGPARAAARLSADASDAQVEAARTEVALQARTAYYDALLARELVRVQEQALAQAERRLEQVQEFYRAGTGSEFDRLTARVEVDNVRPDLIAARNRLELDRNRLKRTIGMALDREIVLTDSLPSPGARPASEDSLVRTALRRRSDLRGQELRVRLENENVSSEERSDLPSLELSAGLQRQASSDDLFPPQEDFSQSATAGLSFSVPLFDGRAAAGRVQQARAAHTRETFRLGQLRENIRLEVQQAHQSLNAARERVQASRANVDRAERALEIAQSRFEEGLSTQVELNDAELAVTRARTNLAQARHDYAVARAELVAATGRR